MGFFHKYIVVGLEALPPVELIVRAEKLARDSKTPEQAQAALDRLVPEISNYAPDSRFLLPCGTLLEKKRISDGMLDAWFELHDLFPKELLPVRMMMRWYRRMNQVEEGLVRLKVLCPDRLSDRKQAEQLVFGLLELKDFTGLDSAMCQILAAHPDDHLIRVHYARILSAEERITEAGAVLKGIGKQTRLSPTAQRTIAEIEARAAVLESYDIVDSAAMIGRMVDTFADRPPLQLSESGLGPVIFYTGQLGAGGAERQMTRIAAAFMRFYDEKTRIAGSRMLFPPKVCVRHASPKTGSGFFRPVLEENGIEVHVLNDNALPDIGDFPEIPDALREMLDFLPADIYQNTLKLVRYFKATNAEYVYCWQDGGVLTAALAALIAGVPRIITSFRGMPPNLRPDLHRPQMPYLYKALRRISGVRFSANNAVAARAYEEWLGFEPGEISVIHNAVPVVLPDGDETVRNTWDDILARSPDCHQTVLGVFRFEPVKNPLLWIDVAMAYAQKHEDTRFVAIGPGTLLEECRRRVKKAGFENRIFLPGVTTYVGFFMHRTDILLHLARTEGLPNVVIEGHLSGKPVLATPAGGTAEIFDEGVTGYIFSRADAPAIDEVLDRLETLLGNPDQIEKMGKAGRKYAEKPFSVDSILEKTVSLFIKDWK